MMLREFTDCVSITERFNAFLSSDRELQYIHIYIILSDVSTAFIRGRKKQLVGGDGFFGKSRISLRMR